jgi:hypothetical protein
MRPVSRRAANGPLSQRSNIRAPALQAGCPFISRPSKPGADDTARPGTRKIFAPRSRVKAAAAAAGAVPSAALTRSPGWAALQLSGAGSFRNQFQSPPPARGAARSPAVA